LTELIERDRGVVCVVSVFGIGGSVCGCMYVYTLKHITENSSLEQLLEDLLSRINVNLSSRVSARIDFGTCELFFLLECCARTNSDESLKILQDPLDCTQGIQM